MGPKDVVGVQDVPVMSKIDPRIADVRDNGAVPIRRTIQYADGSYEVFEYDQRDPPPTQGEPWGTKVQTGTNYQQATAYARDQAAEDKGPRVISSAAAGVPTVVYNPVTKQMEQVAGTEHPVTPPAGSQPTADQYGNFWRYNPATNQMEVVGQNPAATQAAAAAAKAAEAKQLIDLLELKQKQGEIDAKQAEAEYKRWYDANYTQPAARAKFNLDLVQEDRANITQAQAQAEKAGSNAVADVVASIPYRFSAGFGDRAGAALQAAQSGGYGPTTLARPIAFPNLAQTRGAAQTAGLGVAANQLGIDLPPAQQALAQVPPYGGPPPAGAYAPTPEEDAAEWARRLAGARTRLGAAPAY